MKKFKKLFGTSEKKLFIYYYPNDNVSVNPAYFTVKIGLQQTCAELIAEIVADPTTPFYAANDLSVHLTSSSANSTSPSDLILSPESVLYDAVKNKKLWILRKNPPPPISDLIVDVFYMVEGSMEQYQIQIPAADAKDNTSLFGTLFRIAKLKAPSTFTSSDCTVTLTMTPENAVSAGCVEFTKGDFHLLRSKQIKIWIVRKLAFRVDISVLNGRDDEKSFEFYPEQDFGFIKWTLASKIKKDIDSFEIVAKNRATLEEATIRMEKKLFNFSNHTFLIRLSKPRIPNDTWLCKHNKNQFDLFFSHRQDPDSDIVEIIHDQLYDVEHQGRKIHSFWDVKCLLTAEDWVDGFLAALHQSNVAVLFISKQCLEKMKNADFERDNVLLEWEETLLRYTSQNLIMFPILVGRDGEKFNAFNHLVFPDEKHCHPRSPKVLTIRKVVEEIFRIQGQSLDELSAEKLEDTKTKLLNTLSKIAGQKSAKPTETPVSVVELVLNSSQDQQLRDVLRPLDKEMKAERSRLLGAHVANTRLWLLKYLLEFLDQTRLVTDGDGGERVVWLQGNAGVGKSVMSAFVANELEKRNLLAGMFFAKHDDTGRNNARNLIRTLCFQLGGWSADFGRIILEKLKDDTVVREALREQANIEKMFEHLILAPLNEIAKTDPKPIVLVVDALDETGMIGYRSEILQVFSLHCKKLPAFVKLLVTSRPEEDIVKTFQALKTKELQATSDGNRQDALIYSKHFLREQGLPDHEVNSLGELLTEKSGGLFVWLAMACRTLKSLTMVGQTITRDAIENLGNGGSDGAMDLIYFATFDRIFGQTPPNVMKDVLSTITIAFEPLNAEDISLLLGLSLDSVEEVVSKLQPILFLSDAGTIRFFHKSVADYLSDPKRCSDLRFFVQTQQFHATLTGKCLDLLQNSLTYNIAQLPLHRLHKDIPEFAELVSEHVSAGLMYAALYFWRHHWESKDFRSNFHAIKTFTGTKLLNWIELLSLLKSTNTIPAATHALSHDYISPQLSPQTTPDYTVELLSDTKRLYQKFNYAILESALQTYVTAIPFSPKETRIYLHYINNLPTKLIPRVVTGSGNKWSACLSTLEGHAGYVLATAISPDGKFLVSGSDNGTIVIWSVDSGEEVKTFAGHSSGVYSVAISMDGRFIISGSGDKTIKIWLMESGEEIKTLAGHSDGVRSVAISMDGRFIVSGSNIELLRSGCLRVVKK